MDQKRHKKPTHSLVNDNKVIPRSYVQNTMEIFLVSQNIEGNTQKGLKNTSKWFQ